MTFERFTIFGWRVKIFNIELVSGMDAHGPYHKFKCPNYLTYIRGLK